MVPMNLSASFTGGTAGPSNATGGYTQAGWDQGDLVITYGEGNANGGARSDAGNPPLGIGWGTWAIAAAVIGGVLLWKRSR